MNINKFYRKCCREWKNLQRQEKSRPPRQSEAAAKIVALFREIDKADINYAKH